ncbi:hypothetical protein X741_32365 [Mesorhizobium sp. LNHC229A00]|nr:hypothetical protein X741_32365 [Mesorhizobium sp. LNHC229A00]
MAGAAVAQDKPRDVAIGVETDAPPFSYVEDRKYTGISNDILQRVADLENLKLNYQSLKFPALIPALQAGQIDLAVAGIYVTEERKKIVDFSSPYSSEGSVLIVPAGSKITDVVGLKGKTIGAEQGSFPLTVANKHAAEWGVTVRVYPDATNSLLAMKMGDPDAMIFDSGLVAYELQMEGSKPTIKIVSGLLDPTDIAFAFPKGSNLRAIIDAGIAKMQANGDMTKIRHKYHLD